MFPRHLCDGRDHVARRIAVSFNHGGDKVGRRERRVALQIDDKVRFFGKLFYRLCGAVCARRTGHRGHHPFHAKLVRVTPDALIVRRDDKRDGRIAFGGSLRDFNNRSAKRLPAIMASACRAGAVDP